MIKHPPVRCRLPQFAGLCVYISSARHNESIVPGNYSRIVTTSSFFSSSSPCPKRAHFVAFRYSFPSLFVQFRSARNCSASLILSSAHPRLAPGTSSLFVLRAVCSARGGSEARQSGRKRYRERQILAVAMDDKYLAYDFVYLRVRCNLQV